MIRFGGLAIDRAARLVELDGAAVDLTRSEFDLLARLAAEPRVAVGSQALLEALWGKAWSGDIGALEAHVSRLRRKLGETAPIRGSSAPCAASGTASSRADAICRRWSRRAMMPSP